ncbi:MAG: hypothetical protein QOJ01_359, partial [Solirubrobacterales bacterium]|nr:hypothetical protein [Solirubrobacterales bacterium]
SCAAAGILIATATRLPAPSPDEGDWRARLSAGIAYVRAHRTLRLLFGAQAAALVFFTAIIPIEVAFAKVDLGAGNFGYGALLASWGVGTIGGGAVFAKLTSHDLRGLVGLSTIAIGVSYVLMGVSPTIAFACGAAVLGGAGNGVQFVAVLTAFQEMAPQHFQARIASLNDAVWRVTPGVGYLFGGLVAALASPRTSFVLAGAGGLVVVAIFGPRLMRLSWAGAADDPAADAETGAVTAEDPAPAHILGAPGPPSGVR